MSSCQVSVVVSTYNRADALGEAISALANQQTGGVTYEVIIVDNNSTDNTRAVIQGWAERHPDLVQYVFEPKQGVSYGRNAGIGRAQGSILAFTDDDIQVEKTWIARLVACFTAHPEASFVGGRVVGIWPDREPLWASTQLCSLALADYGNEVKTVDNSYPISLITANLACRKEVVERVGTFDPQFQRVKGGIGSMEDYEWQLRVMNSGMVGKYDPAIRVFAPVDTDRCRKAYHRRWHFRHGRYRSLFRDPEFEGGSWRFMDTPAHQYRTTGETFLKAAALHLQRDCSAAFRTHCEALDHLGFIWERWIGQLGWRGVSSS